MARSTQRSWLYLSIVGALAGCGPRVDDTEGVDGQAITMTSCSPITASGSYLLTQDLSSADFTTCLDVHDTSNVQIDCAGHSVGGMGTAIAVTHVTAFSVANCTVRNQSNEVAALSVDASSGGSFTHDAIVPVDSNSYALMNVLDSNTITVTNSTFTGLFNQNYTSGTTFASNVMSAHAHDVIYVSSNYGHGNQITGNDIDGTGLADDAILIADESQDQIRNNHVRNVYDAGIETFGVITSTVIDGNTIDGAAIAGIGGYWFTGLASTTISNNTITNSNLAINFFRSCGLRPAGFDSEHEQPAEAAIVFRDNRVVGNHFVPSSPDWPAAAMPVYSIFNAGAYGKLYLSGMTLGPTSICAEVDHLVEPTAADFQLTNNIFAGNDFGVSDDRPYFGEPAVPGRIVDGGGNICGQSTFSPGGDYPLDCGGGSVQGSASIAGSNAPGCVASFDGEATLASLGVAKAGGVVTLQVGTNGGCAFDAASPVPWIRLAKPSAGQLQLIVDPNPGVVRLAVLSIGDRRFGVVEEGQSGMFSDVPYGDTAAFYVYTLSTRGIWPGVGNGAYGRDALVLRQEMAAIIARARYGIGVAGPADPYFSDVPPYNPYFPETQKLMQCEIVTGTSKPGPTSLGTFNPGDDLTREQMAAFIIRAALGGGVCDYDRTSELDYTRPNPNDGFAYPPTPEFADVLDGPYFPFVQEMGALHITSGCSASPPMYCPADNIPHWQLAVFAARGLLGAP